MSISKRMLAAGSKRSDSHPLKSWLVRDGWEAAQQPASTLGHMHGAMSSVFLDDSAAPQPPPPAVEIEPGGRDLPGQLGFAWMQEEDT